MTDDFGLTHAQIAQQSGVSVTTVKSYRSKFPGCFPLRSRGKPLRFAPEAAEACAVIREGYEQGLSTEELRERLQLRFPWSYRRSRSKKPAISPDLTKTVQDLAATVVRLTQSQAATDKRLTRIEKALDTLSAAAAQPSSPGEHPAEHHPEHRAAMDAVTALREDLHALRDQVEVRTRPFPGQDDADAPGDQAALDALREELIALRDRVEESSHPVADPHASTTLDALREELAALRTQVNESAPFAAHPDGPVELDALRAELHALRARMDEGDPAAPAQDATGAATGAPAPQSGPAFAGPAKVVRVRTPSGTYERYALHRLPAEQDGAAPTGKPPTAPPHQDEAASGPQPPRPTTTGTERHTAPPAPPQDAQPDAAPRAEDASDPDTPGAPDALPPDAFLDLPMTVRSAKGEVLGVAGRDGHLTVRDFPALMARTLGPGPLAATWNAEPDGWRLRLDADPPHTFALADTVTPRGNRVALVQDLRIGDAPQTPETMLALLRTLRNAITD